MIFTGKPGKNSGIVNSITKPRKVAPMSSRCLDNVLLVNSDNVTPIQVGNHNNPGHTSSKVSTKISPKGVASKVTDNITHPLTRTVDTVRSNKDSSLQHRDAICAQACTRRKVAPNRPLSLMKSDKKMDSDTIKSG